MNFWLQLLGWALGMVVFVLVLNRIVARMEAKGWIQPKEGRRGSAVGNAFLEVQSLIEPQKRYVLEAKQESRRQQDETGDPPSEEK